MSFGFNVAAFMALGMAVGVAACTPKEKTEGAEAGIATVASAQAPAVASAAPSEPPATAENDPLPAHSEATKKARAEITKQNYKSELDKLEKEIDQP
ncbi:hypothetical protein LVJ94_33465 [Pendulispora rubella]|uniref:Lipoprotein n=1 Tax=Pendulispora rubella TaxID=2741070 RepID=A0ABZ2KWX9_9BACT